MTDARLHTLSVHVLTGSPDADRRMHTLSVAVLVSTSPPANDLWVWNGTTAVPANVSVWNGSAEAAANVSVLP